MKCYLEQIACNTCKFNIGTRCTKNDEDGDCLRSRYLGPAVSYYVNKIPKREPRYNYAYWEPAWSKEHDFILPDDLFEI